MYTLHSWLGLVFVILFGLQLMGGLFSFLFPLVGPAVRSKILPVHRASGIILFTGIGKAMFEEVITAFSSWNRDDRNQREARV